MASPSVDVDEKVVAELCLSITRLGRQLRQQVVARDQVTLSQLSAISVVANNPGITLGELAKREQVKPPTMSRLVVALEELGYIKRLSDDNDRRAVRVDLTAKGRRLIERRRSERNVLLTERVAELSDEDKLRLPDVVDILRSLQAPLTRAKQGTPR